MPVRRALAVAAALGATSAATLGASAAAATRRHAAATNRTSLCTLYVSDAFRGFRYARVDFATPALVDLVSLPTLGGVGNGIVAADGNGLVYFPDADVAYNFLRIVDAAANSSSSATIAPPPGLSGVPAFYDMDVNTSSNTLFGLLEESSLRWVVVAAIDAAAGTSTALTADFKAAWLANFAWRKVGVTALDTARDVLYFVAANVSAPDTELFVGVNVAAGPAAPVAFSYFLGPDGTDITSAAYSGALDAFVVAAFNISTGVTTVWTSPAGDGAGTWTRVYDLPAGKDNDMSLGNAILSDDGVTVFFTLSDDKTGNPLFVALNVVSGAVQASYLVPEATRPAMLVGDIVPC